MLDIKTVKPREKEGRVMKILVGIDLTKPFMRGTWLRHRQKEEWVAFKYEQLPMFYFYCGCIGQNERVCGRRKKDVGKVCVREEQYGNWLRVVFVKRGMGFVKYIFLLLYF